MKSILLILVSFFSFATASAQDKQPLPSKPDPNKKVQVVEAGCGQCQLGLKGASCDLAVKIDGKAYFVDGTKIDDHGDAHEKDGFCNAVRKAEVQGDVVGDRFKVTYFKLVKR
ncbi:MAG: hypothetical protein H7Y42_16985 [Chitinophagaceae bacterium]|nr:hypothetical protein [Chitinophagaceae bacterium]